MSLSEIGVIS